jgi:hypothetical protein
MKHFALLITVNIISFISVCSFTLTPDVNYNVSLDLFRLFVPGVVFAIFIIVYQIKKLTIIKLLSLFIILVGGYYLNLAIGLSSWGYSGPYRRRTWWSIN